LGDEGWVKTIQEMQTRNAATSTESSPGKLVQEEESRIDLLRIASATAMPQQRCYQIATKPKETAS
jgi:hypothetical protein